MGTKQDGGIAQFFTMPGTFVNQWKLDPSPAPRTQDDVRKRVAKTLEAAGYDGRPGDWGTQAEVASRRKHHAEIRKAKNAINKLRQALHYLIDENNSIGLGLEINLSLVTEGRPFVSMEDLRRWGNTLGEMEIYLEARSNVKRGCAGRPPRDPLYDTWLVALRSLGLGYRLIDAAMDALGFDRHPPDAAKTDDKRRLKRLKGKSAKK